MNKYLFCTLIFSSSLNAQTFSGNYPKSIIQFCNVLERDILSYYQIEIESNIKYTNNNLPLAERNQSRDIAIAIKDSRIKTEESWQRVGCSLLINRK